MDKYSLSWLPRSLFGLSEQTAVSSRCCDCLWGAKSVVANRASGQNCQIKVVAHKIEWRQFFCFCGARTIADDRSQDLIQAVIADQRGGNPCALLLDPDMPHRTIGAYSSLPAEDRAFLCWIYHRKLLPIGRSTFLKRVDVQSPAWAIR